MTEFVPFWEDKEFGGDLGPSPLPEDHQDLFNINLLCDEDALDAVVPEPVEAADDCLLPHALDESEDAENGTDFPGAVTNWCNFFDNNISLSKRVSVTVTGKRKIDHESSPSRPQSCYLKRPKSINLSHTRLTEDHQSPSSYDHGHNVDNGMTRRTNARRYTFGYGSIRDEALQVRTDGTAVYSPTAASLSKRRHGYRRSTTATGVHPPFAMEDDEASAFVMDVGARESETSAQLKGNGSEGLRETALGRGLTELEFQGDPFNQLVGLGINDAACLTEDAYGNKRDMETAYEDKAMSNFTDSSEDGGSLDGHLSVELAHRLQSVSAAKLSGDSSASSSSLMSGHLHLPAASARGLPEVTSAIRAVTLAAQAYSESLTQSSTCSSPSRGDLQQEPALRHGKRQSFRQGNLNAFALNTKKKKLIGTRVTRKRASLTKFDEPLMPAVPGDMMKAEHCRPSALQMYINCAYNSSGGGGMLQ